MGAYPIVYLEDVVENQGKLFDYVAYSYPNKDTKDFIRSYMNSQTRKNIDNGEAYITTMSYKELWEYFCENENYVLKDGDSIKGFMPDWIGEFYAYYQWYYHISSADVLKRVPLEFIMKAYYGLHDLDLELAVRKVGELI